MAYHFNWGHDEVLAMPHWERQRWCEEISAINERMNQGGGSGPSPPSGIPAGPQGGPGAPAGGPSGAPGSPEGSGGAPSLEQDIPDEFWEEEQESFLDTDEDETEEPDEEES